jgi:dihydroorotase-like cyclic amidohydrolase
MSARTILNPPISLNGGNAVLNVDEITATGTITAGTGLIVSSGGLQVEAGGAEITAGGLTVVDGGIDVNSGGITSGSTITASGTITATTFAGGIVAHNGNFTDTWAANSAVATSITIPNIDDNDET